MTFKREGTAAQTGVNLPVNLDESVLQLPGVGEKRAEALAQLGVACVRDLLFHFPRAYEDRRKITPIADVVEGGAVTILAEVVKARALRLRRRLSLADVTLKDATGTLRAVWFGQDYLVRVLKPGSRGFFTGAVGAWKGPALRNPDYELLSGDEDDLLNSGRIVPVYRLTEGVTQRMLRRLVRTALDALTVPLSETLPDAIRTRHGLPSANDAMRVVHYPDDLDAARTARNRFAFEELLGIQLGVLAARARRRQEHKKNIHTIAGPHLAALRSGIPFALTSTQLRAIDDILSDMVSTRPMVRTPSSDMPRTIRPPGVSTFSVRTARSTSWAVSE